MATPPSSPPTSPKPPRSPKPQAWSPPSSPPTSPKPPRSPKSQAWSPPSSPLGFLLPNASEGLSTVYETDFSKGTYSQDDDTDYSYESSDYSIEGTEGSLSSMSLLSMEQRDDQEDSFLGMILDNSCVQAFVENSPISPRHCDTDAAACLDERPKKTFEPSLLHSSRTLLGRGRGVPYYRGQKKSKSTRKKDVELLPTNPLFDKQASAELRKQMLAGRKSRSSKNKGRKRSSRKSKSTHRAKESQKTGESE